LGFAASLHPLSLAAAVRASALRTPHRVAVVENGVARTYADLLSTVPAQDSDEDPRERALMLRALDNVVQHPVFDRDAVTASSLPPMSETGAVAAAVALILGCTLHRVGGLELAEGIAAGRFQTCWLASDALPGDLPPPASGFRLALCDGEPSPRLISWLGLERVTRAT
jgi:hypothetical protein